jgi:UDP-N-acetylglucosamine acyltransferase
MPATIGPRTSIGPDVVRGANTTIESHCVIQGPCDIGDGNHIHAFTSVGAPSQDKKFTGEHSKLIIGNHNIIREFVTIHRGNNHGLTQVGSYNLFMNYCHIAHDCIVGDNCIFSNSTTLAGHVTIGDYVIISGLTAVHQFCSIGNHAFVTGG